MMKMLLVPQTDIDTAWPFVRDFLRKPLEAVNDEMDLEDVYRFLQQGVWQLWVGSEKGVLVGAGTTEIVNAPLKRILRLVLLGADNSEGFLEEWPVLEQFAKDCGCAGIETYCRRGLKKFYQKLGYHHRYEVMVKNLIGD